MDDAIQRSVAVVGLGAILPDAMNVAAFWQNLLDKRYSISETPTNRWNIEDYYDPDPNTPDKSYSKIGGWVKDFQFDWKAFRMPPKVAAAMDLSQQWAVTASLQALKDYGYPDRPLDTERTGVILGTAMGGELHYQTFLRASLPAYLHTLQASPNFQNLPADQRQAIIDQMRAAVEKEYPPITEDSMPGELPNIVSGRVANLLNLRGPNFITDAACAASMAAVQSAVDLLNRRVVDAVLTGGVDHNMGAAIFIKFCKIGALSATGTRPFGEGADGFVMGEGGAVFLLKRLEDAVRDGDMIYAVIRGIGGASDGRGKGITAPNPIGQQLAIQRAWQSAGLDPATANLIEAHGTSTRVGDVVEVESLANVFCGARRGSLALGSVKSNIGHLKAAAGAAGLLKAILALHHKVLPPTLNADTPNPEIDFKNSPFYLNTQARVWERNGTPRRCGVSAYGFGGTNFHAVLEEYTPGMLGQDRLYQAVVLPNTGRRYEAIPVGNYFRQACFVAPLSQAIQPVRGILALCGPDAASLRSQVQEAQQRAEEGQIPLRELPSKAVIESPERLVIDFGTPEELVDRLGKAAKALAQDARPVWAALQAQGIFRGSGKQPGKVAFLFPGQGSQYVNMCKEIRQLSPGAAEVFARSDAVMQPILGKPLADFIFADGQDETAVKQIEQGLRQTAITQPAVLTVDMALYQALGEYGFQPDMVMGHSLGEYGALVAAGIMNFEDVLEAAAARGIEMSKVKVDDPGWMAAVMAPTDVVQATLNELDGYLVIANLNSNNQCVIGGDSQAVEHAIQVFQGKGFQAQRLPVSHAFHTRIVAPASGPLRKVLDRLHITPPKLPMVANLNGEFYPTDVNDVKGILERQIASPVQWVKGLETLYQAGARIFVEVGPKKALKGFVDDVLANKGDVVSLFSNHPKVGELASFNQALCGLYACGVNPGGVYTGVAYTSAGITEEKQAAPVTINSMYTALGAASVPNLLRVEGDVKMFEPEKEETAFPGNGHKSQPDGRVTPGDLHGSIPLQALGPVVALAVAEGLKQALEEIGEQKISSPAGRVYDRNQPPSGSVVITGTGLGLPGADKPVMDPDNANRILRGEQFVDLIPERFRKGMLARRVTRLVKDADGSGSFQPITDVIDVIKLAGRKGYFNLEEEYGVPGKLVEALDITTQLAIAAGLDALREAGIPLVQVYKRTTTGKFLPDRWMLPEAYRDETGVIFASAFPGGDRMANEFKRYHIFENRLQQKAMLEDLRARATEPAVLDEINRRLAEINDALQREPYEFDRRFLFRVLSMGHSQFAEYIGARGPNTQVNAACASTTQAIGLADDWIRNGRCRRVVVIAGDDVSGDNLMEWVGAGFLASGAAATDDRVEEACLPFDRRRHGLVVGMGACALVVESEDAARQRGVRGIVELLSSESDNSAFHGTRLNVEHIAGVMEELISGAEQRFGLARSAIAGQTVFMSHETFTPARGGSASAEVVALQHTFGEAAKDVVVANTKGFTGHAMGVGVEDVIAVKILEHGIVPPVPNYKEVDEELGELNLSRGGRYPVLYALHLAAGFGSQIAMTLIRRIPGGPDRIDRNVYGHWLSEVSGYNYPETEVVKRVLRVKSDHAPERLPVPSQWKRGTGPAVRVSVEMGGNGDHHYAPRMTMLEHIPDQRIPRERMPVELPTPPLPLPLESIPNTGIMPVTAQPVEKAGAEKPGTAASSPAAPVQPAAAQSGDPVKEKVLEIVAQKTGYPVEMLELDLDLEADLGIDTVKQAETFLAIREAFDIPKQENVKLRDYPTLAHCIRFVKVARPDLAGEPFQAAQAVNTETVQLANAQPVQEQPASVPVTNSAGEGDPVKDKVLEIVAQKTGYPVDMLEVDLDLEADLGIDTVKQAETFMAIRETFDIPKQENLKLRDYPTLAHCIQYVKDNRPDLIAEKALDEDKNLPVEGKQAVERLAHPFGSLDDADRVPRRVPAPVLRPALELCKPTGVKLDKDSRVLVALDKGKAGKGLLAALKHRKVKPISFCADLPADELEQSLKDWLAEGPITGVYWLPALDVEPPVEQMDLAEWHEQVRIRVKNLYTTMRLLYEHMNQPGAFLVTATRLGGLHGYGPQPALAPLGGAVTGFTKAFKRERPLALVKAVDFEDGNSTSVADALIGETLADPGIIESGYWQGGRYSVALKEQPAADGNPGMLLEEDKVFLVTGAAGSITSAIVADLAAESAGTFYLLDLAEFPKPGDEHVRLFRQDKEALKKALIAEAQAIGEKVTPVIIDKKIAAIERQEAALRAVESVKAAGGEAIYYSANLLDAPAVQTIIENVRQKHGKIDVLIHAAGLEISRSLPDKDPAQFNLVFDVKADGFFNLLHAAWGLPIGATVAFSSVAGRFGNSGQTDYSAANDLLCKITSSMQIWRPETRGIAIDWTAWDKIGMATRGSIPRLMSAAGIDMLPPESGIPTIRRELVRGGRRGEIVVAGRLGVLEQEWDPEGGLDPGKASAWLNGLLPRPRMIGSLKSSALTGVLSAETCLDPKEQPFLYDHQMDGTPLLPGAMVTETFSELAAVLASAGAQGYKVQAVEGEQFLAPFKFYRMEPQTLYMQAAAEPAENGELVVKTSLHSIRPPARDGLPVQEKLHFTAQVRLARTGHAAPEIEFNLPDDVWHAMPREGIYKIYFHGPAYQVLEKVMVGGDTAVGMLSAGLPPDFFRSEGVFQMAPRLLELCFQTAGAWQIKHKGMLALPNSVALVSAYRQLEECPVNRRLYALVSVLRDGEAFNARVMDDQGDVYLCLRGYTTIALPE